MRYDLMQVNATLAALPISAKKVFLMALRGVDKRKEIENGTKFTIKADDYAKVANISLSDAYSELIDGAVFLQQSYFTLDDKDIESMSEFLKIPDQFKKSKELVINLTKSVSYDSELGTLILEFNDYILPLITVLKGEEEK